MTKDLLLTIITKLNQCGFDVVALVSEMGLSNIGLWKSLNITTENTFFTHPIINNNVYMFADIPQFLKLARHHFLDSGFVLPNGKYLGKNVILEYLKVCKGDFSHAYKVSENHINVVGIQRPNVKIAAQFFSNSIAKALTYFEEKSMIRNYNRKEVIF